MMALRTTALVVGLVLCTASSSSSSASSEGAYDKATVSKLASYDGDVSIEGTFKFSKSEGAASSAHRARRLGGGAAASEEDEEVDYTYKIGISLSHLEAEGLKGGWHVHEGHSCDEPGGHFSLDNGEDPWTSEWTSDSHEEFASTDTIVAFDKSVVGHVVVVHLADGTKAACGLIETPQIVHPPTTDAPIIQVGAALGALVFCCIVFFIMKSNEYRAAKKAAAAPAVQVKTAIACI
jgi:hypothetical protein